MLIFNFFLSFLQINLLIFLKYIYFHDSIFFFFIFKSKMNSISFQSNEIYKLNKSNFENEMTLK